LKCGEKYRGRQQPTTAIFFIVGVKEATIAHKLIIRSGWKAAIYCEPEKRKNDGGYKHHTSVMTPHFFPCKS